MKTRTVVNSFLVLEHLDESVDEQIERNINEQPGRFVQATEERLVGAKIRVRVYMEVQVPDNTEENKQ